MWNLQSLTMDELPKNVEMLTDLEYLDLMCKFTLVTGSSKKDSTATTVPADSGHGAEAMTRFFAS